MSPNVPLVKVSRGSINRGIFFGHSANSEKGLKEQRSEDDNSVYHMVDNGGGPWEKHQALNFSISQMVLPMNHNVCEWHRIHRVSSGGQIW